MCGIVGYVGGREACPVLLKGLHRLEYRGYDSAGVAMVGKDGALNVYKCKGKVSDLKHFLEGKELGGSIGIAHTRWATGLKEHFLVPGEHPIFTGYPWRGSR